MAWQDLTLLVTDTPNLTADGTVIVCHGNVPHSALDFIVSHLYKIPLRASLPSRGHTPRPVTLAEPGGAWLPGDRHFLAAVAAPGGEDGRGGSGPGWLPCTVCY